MSQTLRGGGGRGHSIWPWWGCENESNHGAHLLPFTTGQASNVRVSVPGVIYMSTGVMYGLPEITYMNQ